MDPLQAPIRLDSQEVFYEEPTPIPPRFRSNDTCRTGLVLAYPDRCYADRYGLTLLNQLREYLPMAGDGGGLPVQIMKCCTTARNRDVLETVEEFALTGTFDLGTKHIRFRVFSLPPKRSAHRDRVLVLLESIPNHAPSLGCASSQAERSYKPSSSRFV